jgi:hypothetical protein
MFRGARSLFSYSYALALISCSDVDTAQVTVEGENTNSAAKAINERAVTIPAVRNSNDPNLQHEILNNVMETSERRR